MTTSDFGYETPGLDAFGRPVTIKLTITDDDRIGLHVPREFAEFDPGHADRFVEQVCSLKSIVEHRARREQT